jgi:hypothetical protein
LQALADYPDSQLFQIQKLHHESKGKKVLEGLKKEQEINPESD